MTKRGKVLRDTTLGPGLLIMEGQQYRFSLEGEWKSGVPPKPGQVVNVELDVQGKIQGITVVSDSQLAREQAEAVLASSRPIGRNLASSLVARIGMPSLAALGLLAAAWFFLTAASIQVPFPGKLEFTFWQILGFLNAGNVSELLDGSRSPNSGLYGLAAIIALAGPFIHFFWKDKRAQLGGLLPLLFMVIVAIAVRSNIYGALGSGNNAGVAEQAHPDAMRTISLGLGAYLSALASSYFAFVSARRLGARASERPALESTPRKAA